MLLITTFNYTKDKYYEKGYKAYLDSGDCTIPISLNMTGLNGCYYPSHQTYCVKIGNRTLEEIQRTECHEICHHLVHKDWEHFCDWK